MISFKYGKMIAIRKVSLLAVMLVFSIALPTPAGSQGSSSIIFFPQSKPPERIENESYMMSRNTGKLILKDGCLRLENSEESYLLIWPGWFSFEIVNRLIHFRYTRLGKTLTRVKPRDTITIAGGAVDDRPYNTQQPIPKQCKGPYWMVGDIKLVKKSKKLTNAIRHSR
jgi:hypothetical protein